MVFIALVVTSVLLPSLNKTLSSMRISGDARSIASALTQAKMRAGSTFSREQLQIDTTNKTFQLFQKSTSGGSYVSDGGAQYLKSGVSFGYGSITATAGGQSTISQSTAVTFNSRGIPITDDTAGNAKSDYAIYINDSSGTYYAITLSLTGRVQISKYSGGTWVAQ